MVTRIGRWRCRLATLITSVTCFSLNCPLVTPNDCYWDQRVDRIVSEFKKKDLLTCLKHLYYVNVTAVLAKGPPSIDFVEQRSYREISRPCMHPGSSSPCSQQPTTDVYPESDKSPSPILMPAHRRQGLPGELFPSGSWCVKTGICFHGSLCQGLGRKQVFL